MDNILTIIDEINFRQLISHNFNKDGFNIIETENFDHVNDIISKESICCILLSFKNPSLSVVNLCNSLKKLHPEIVIIAIATSQNNLDDFVELKITTDKCIVMPANVEDLIDEVKIELKKSKIRIQKETLNKIVYDDILVDLNSKKIFLRGDHVKLTSKEYLLLITIIKEPEKTFTRDDLLDIIWGTDFMGDIKTVDVHVRRLREKLEDDPKKPKYFLTSWGHGYKWGG